MRKYIIFLSITLISFSVRSQNIELELIVDGFDQPLGIQNSGDQRLFIVEKEGKIKIIQEDGTLSSTSFLDVSEKITTNGERGLLGLAFHPAYSENGFFYVNYTDLNGNTRVSRFKVKTSDPNVADPESELEIISYDQPNSNHNGGDILFGPDGYLYISSGDGGQSGDPANRAQSLNEYLGKILRIDVDSPSGEKNYSIPEDNPFVNTPGARPEIWAYGLRNPWRFSIDTEKNNIWIADVGQADREEINRQPLDSAGLNYGWRCYEGSLPFNTTDCPPESELTFPVAEYSHDNGNCSITGGTVYRGMKYADMVGRYFFADYCSGMIAGLNEDDSIHIYGNFDGQWVAIGEDVNKELYIADISGGKIYRIKGEELMGVPAEKEFSPELIPNPTAEFFNIAIDETIEEIQIFDIQGRQIRKISAISKNQRIEVANFNPGLYFVRIKGNANRVATKKLLIQ